MSHSTFLHSLKNPDIYPHATRNIELIETHISWVILTGDFAYKIKKPVNLGFLDFSSLAKRQYFCQQELQLNQRLAPDLYLSVVALCGEPSSPELDSLKPVFEYAIKMRQFDPEQQFDRLSDKALLNANHIDLLADNIANFHSHCEVATSEQSFGEAAAIWQPVQENFEQIRALLEIEDALAQLSTLEHWNQTQFEQLKPIIKQRKQQGFVRNVHGDMHLGNITLVDEKPLIFDCIEFNDQFRWIDVISDIAFTLMDLHVRGNSALAHRLLDRYLQRTGDYEGLALLDFYQVYRALVRAKVAIIRSSQPNLSEEQRQTLLADFHQYLTLAAGFTHRSKPVLFIAHGLSGSGKTVLSQPLLEKFGIVRLRSDVERKRLFGLTAEARSHSQSGEGIYQTDASQRTYARLLVITKQLLQAGYSTLVDATFLKARQRSLFKSLAMETGTTFIILHFYADEKLLKQWISERLANGQDASEATLEVLAQQIATEERLNDDEADQIIAINSEFDNASETLIQAVSILLKHGRTLE